VPTDVKIWAGALNIYDAAGYMVDVAEIHVHPDYNSATTENDVTVIKLAKPFPRSVGVRAIQLAANQVAEGTTVTVCGWGNIGDSYPEDLMYVDTNVLSNAVCSEFYSGVFDSVMVCAGSSTHGSCHGDSGGPFFTGLKSKALQHGVVSWGSGSCDAGPTVYARVAPFRDWIVEQTKHIVATSCAGCDDNNAWKEMCESVDGNYRKTTNGYQCRDLDVIKTRKINYQWTNCGNKVLRDLCEKIGRFTCTDNVPQCSRM